MDLVVFMHEIKELLKDKGADMLARQVDIGLIQRVSVAELFRTGRTVGACSRGSTGSAAALPWRLSVKSSARRKS